MEDAFHGLATRTASLPVSTGLIHSATVRAVPEMLRLGELGTSTESFDPSKIRPLPYRPEGVQVGPASWPSLAKGETSPAAVPVPSANGQAPTSPAVETEQGTASTTCGPRSPEPAVPSPPGPTAVVRNQYSSPTGGAGLSSGDGPVVAEKKRPTRQESMEPSRSSSRVPEVPR